MSGVWTQGVNDAYPGETGTLYCWGLDTSEPLVHQYNTCSSAHTVLDLARALSIGAGSSERSSDDLTRLNTVTGN